MVRKYLLENHYDDIWFKPHGKRNDLVFTQGGNYLAQDIWNLFDGICLDPDGYLVFLQMKTNAWAKGEPIRKFLKKTHCLQVLSFNVTNKLKDCKGRYKVKVREYL